MPEEAALSVADLVSALEVAHAALDGIAVTGCDGRQTGWASTDDLDGHDLERLVGSVARLEGRVQGLKLHVATAAERACAAEGSGDTSTAAWAARAAGKNRSRSWMPLWLAELLEEKYHHTRAALATGRITEDHAAIIVRTAESAPDGVSADELATCEANMVVKAEQLPPAKLRRAVKRLLDPISKRLADEHEAGELETEEGRAEREAFFSIGERSDGNWVGKLCLPEMHARLLIAVLDHLASPRRLSRRDGELVSDPTGPTPNILESRGRALCELIEHLPTDKLGAGAVNLVVHIDHDRLVDGLGAAQLDTGVRISAGEARRLACNAGIIPMVLGGGSVPLDLGRKNRLFTTGQAIALSARYDSCAAEGCDRPFAWSELHHLKPWGEGGATDLANAIPLCGHHHRRIHDQHYLWEQLPDGQVRFEHRWRSRRRRMAQAA